MVTEYLVLGSFQIIASSDSSNVASSSLAFLFGTNKHVYPAFSPGNNPKRGKQVRIDVIQPI